MDPTLLVKKDSSGFFGRSQALARFYIVKQRLADGTYNYNGLVLLDAARWRAGDPLSMATLVHELIHYGQALAIFDAIKSRGADGLRTLEASKGWGCWRSVEAEAYTVENRWARKFSGREVASAMHIATVSSCKTDDPGSIALFERAVDLDDLIRATPTR